MKILNIAALGLLATVAFTSCEMKEELYGGKDKGAEQGTLELGVTVKQPFSMSRAETVSTDNFPVTIEGDQLDNTLEYAKASEVPTLLTLPVGDYKVSAHSPIKLEKQMTEPYYAGEGNYKYYKLSYDDNDANIGFYWGAENGAAFMNKAGKAYLALPVTESQSMAKGFSLSDLANGTTTSIQQASIADKAVPIFDINGRRVSTLNGAAKGVYIVGGKKVMVK